MDILTRTAGGHDIYVITTGSGDTGNKPGVAIIGGVTGPARYSTELVLRMAERMAGSALTDKVTFYFFPDMTPDAGSAYFSSPRYERERNAVPVDEDHDGKTDEDGYDDMNGDGIISWMRVRDTVTGSWIIHPGNPMVMVKADPAKNESGKYILMKEGFDNDGDGKINEDVEGGVIFDKNFSFNYQDFSPGSGINTLSEKETRALAKFLFDHWNIYSVFAIGPGNNLSDYNDLGVDLHDKSLPATVSKADKPFFERMVKVYNENVNLPERSVSPPEGGDLLSWAYFHYNRFAFSTPAWNIKKEKDDHGSTEYDYLSGKTAGDVSGESKEWEKIDHPDFPGRTVEIGGIKPFAIANPPNSAMDSTTDNHFKFLTELAALHPELSIDVKRVIGRGDNIFQVEAEVMNSGGFPTMPELAVKSRWLKKVRVELKTNPGGEITGGRQVILFDRIEPGETRKLNWIIRGGGIVTISAGSPQTGYVNRIVELK